MQTWHLFSMVIRGPLAWLCDWLCHGTLEQELGFNWMRFGLHCRQMSGCWCLVSDVWDLTGWHIPGRHPHFKPLLQNRDFYRHWDTDGSGFHVYINMNVVIKTVNKTQQGCMLYMANAMTAWKNQLLRTMFFHSFQGSILVHLKYCVIIHSSYGFLWVQTPPCYSIGSPWQLKMFDSFSLVWKKAENWNMIIYRCSVSSIQSFLKTAEVQLSVTLEWPSHMSKWDP